MANIFYKLCVPQVAELQPYLPGKPITELEREYGISNSIKVASNENPLGISSKVKDVLIRNFDQLSRYPDGNGFLLKTMLAGFYNIKPEQITLGNGSNDILELIARVFVSIGDEVIFSEYAFAVYSLVTQAIAAVAVVTKAKNWGYDLDEILSAITDKTKLIFIANPNNPTGTWLNKNELSRFLDKVPDNIIVVLDEAYFEYASHKSMNIFDYPDGLQWLSKHSNLIVTRTFSKAYGLAGLRAGYSISHSDLANILNRIRQPFNVNSMALMAAETVLGDKAFLQESIELNAAGMNYLTSEFDNLNLRFIKSAGNFITVYIGEFANNIYQELLRVGVIVRPLNNYGLDHYLRFSIGSNIENQRVILELKKVVNYSE